MDAVMNKINNYYPVTFSQNRAGVVGSSALKLESSAVFEEDKSGFSKDAASLEISTKAMDAYKAMYDEKEETSIPSEAVKKQVEAAIEAAKERAKELEQFRTERNEKNSYEEVTAFAGYSMNQIEDMYYDGKINYKTYTEEIEIKKTRMDEALTGSGQ